MADVQATVDSLRQYASERGTTATIAVGILIAAVLLPALLASLPLSRLPLVGQEYGSYRKREKQFLANARALYAEGYRKFRSSIWRLTTADGEHIIVPHTLLPELRTKSDEEISNRKALNIFVESKYSGLVSDSDLLNHAVRADLTPGLVRINPRLSKEVERTMETELPPCKDWTPLIINQKLLRIVAIASGHIFLGPELCRDERYIHSSINFTVDVFTGIRALKMWPKWLRWYGAYRTPELQSVKVHKANAAEFLAPIIKERREAMNRGEKDLPDDMLQWMMTKSDKFGVGDAQMAWTQLVLSMAAIHTTTGTTTQIIYDLVSMPELIPILREEIRTVLKEHDGIFTTQALYHMKLLDSVMKESMRVNPLNFTRFNRVVGEKGVTLKDGTQLPPNAIISVPMDALSHDPTLFPDPDKFDPYRYYNLRNAGGEDANRHQAASVTETALGFGYGRHACPGRFFAINEIKLILANMLLQFDFKMKDGETKRIPNIVVGSQLIPTPRAEILFKRKAK